MRTKQTRIAYNAAFKIKVVQYAKEHGNRVAERHFGPPPTEKMIREWRKQEERLLKMDKTKHNFRGCTAKWPKLEDDVKNWIISQRMKGLDVTTKLILIEARRLALESKIEDFSGTTSWCDRFMKRHGLHVHVHIRKKTAQGIPNKYEEKPVDCHKFVISERKQAIFELGQITNMDEVSLTFKVPSNETMDIKDFSGHEKIHYTVVLACCANGTKLMPTLIFKGNTLPKIKIPSGIFVYANPKGWMDEKGMKLWLEKVWLIRPGGLLKKPSLLVLDLFRAHITSEAKKRFAELNTKIAVIPGGLMNQLQSVDVSVNESFKANMHEEWNKWMSSPNHERKIKRPTVSDVCKWVKHAWHQIKEETVVQSFKKCGVSNALDDTEDDLHLLYEDSDSTTIYSSDDE